MVLYAYRLYKQLMRKIMIWNGSPETCESLTSLRCFRPTIWGFAGCRAVSLSNKDVQLYFCMIELWWRNKWLPSDAAWEKWHLNGDSVLLIAFTCPLKFRDHGFTVNVSLQTGLRTVLTDYLILPTIEPHTSFNNKAMLLPEIFSLVMYGLHNVSLSKENFEITPLCILWWNNNILLCDAVQLQCGMVF